MANIKFSQIASAPSNFASTDTLVGVRNGTTDYQFSYAQLVAGIGSGTTYYVATGGNDSNDGLSPANAWASISHVNSQSFNPGDCILFDGGETFSGAIVCPSAGLPGKPITFGSYGGGQATISSSTSTGFSSTNQSGIVVRDLIFTGSAGSSNNGIAFNNTGTTQLFDVRIINCSVSGYGWSGIFLNPSSTAGYSDIIIEGCTTNSNCNSGGYATAGVQIGGQSGGSCTNFQVANCVSVGNLGGSYVNSSGFGFFCFNSSYGCFINCLAAVNGGSCVATGTDNGGPSGFGCFASLYVNFEGCQSFSNRTATIYSGTYWDGNGYDISDGCQYCTLSNCYSENNYGTGFNQGSVTGSPQAQEGVSFIGCVSVNDGTGGSSNINPYGIAIEANGGANTLVLVSGCTVYQSNSGAGCLSIEATPTGWVTGCTFVTNGNLYLVNSSNAGGMHLVGNKYFSPSFLASWNSTNYSSLAAFAVGSGQEGSLSNIHAQEVDVLGITTDIVLAPWATANAFNAISLNGALDTTMQGLLGGYPSANTLYFASPSASDRFSFGLGFSTTLASLSNSAITFGNSSGNILNLTGTTFEYDLPGVARLLDYGVTTANTWTFSSSKNVAITGSLLIQNIEPRGASGSQPGIYTQLTTDTAGDNRISMALDGSDNPYLGLGPGGSAAEDIFLNRQSSNVFGVGTTSTNTAGSIKAAGFLLAGSSSGTTTLAASATASGTATFPANSGTVAELNLAQTWTAAQTFNNSFLVLAGSSSGTTTLEATAAAGTTVATFPANTGTVAELNLAQTWSAIQTFGGITMTDATNIAIGSSTGTKIATATTQKIGFYNVTPIVQPTAITSPTTFTITTNATTTTPWGYATSTQANNIAAQVSSNSHAIISINTALVNLGLVA